MHFNFHLSGDESAEQTRRIANAVLALGGATLQIQDSDLNLGEEPLTYEAEAFGVQPDGIVTEKGKPPRLATMEEMLTAGHHVTQGSGRYAEPSTKDGTSAKVTATPKTLGFRAGKGAAVWVDEDAVTANAGESPSEHVGPITLANFGMTEEETEALLTAMEDDITIPIPVVTPAPPAHAANPSGLDSKGLPWDERIHSGSRKFNADGSWRYRKNVPDETKAAVEGELRGMLTVGNYSDDPVLDAALQKDAQYIRDMGGDPGPTMQDFGLTPAFAIPVPPAPPLPPVVTHVALVDPGTLRDPNTVVNPPAPPTNATRTYPDVVNLIMKHKITPETYVAIIGSDLPTFAATCKTDPNAASVAFDALELASRS